MASLEPMLRGDFTSAAPLWALATKPIPPLSFTAQKLSFYRACSIQLSQHLSLESLLCKMQHCSINQVRSKSWFENTQEILLAETSLQNQ